MGSSPLISAFADSIRWVGAGDVEPDSTRVPLDPVSAGRGAQSCREDQRSAARMIETALTTNPTIQPATS
jgi:hypothetical protein